ncbi:hypothetical protein SE2072C2_48870 (plasmid) [Salmonella enterica]|nr:hypothetical protein SE2072C2_48870 [Salmonella enterica]
MCRKALKCFGKVEKCRTVDKKKSSVSFGLATVPKQTEDLYFYGKII